jgi:hypothetical protein
MRTEPLPTRAARGPDHDGPAALADHALDWQLVDDRDHPVGLSLAGCVLHFGHAYHLRVGPLEPGGPLPPVRLHSRFDWLERIDGPEEVAKHGREYACVHFRVRRQIAWLNLWKWPFELYHGELEFEGSVPGQGDTEPRTGVCPIIARTRWHSGVPLLVLLGLVVGVVLALVQELFGHLFRGEDLPERWASAMLGQPALWLGPLGCLALGAVHWIWQLYSRSRELTRRSPSA